MGIFDNMALYFECRINKTGYFLSLNIILINFFPNDCLANKY